MSFRLSRTMSVIVYCMHRNEKRKLQSRSTSSILHNDSQIRLNWPGWTTSWGAGRYPSWRDNQMDWFPMAAPSAPKMSRRVVPKRYPVGEKSVCFSLRLRLQQHHPWWCRRKASCLRIPTYMPSDQRIPQEKSKGAYAIYLYTKSSKRPDIGFWCYRIMAVLHGLRCYPAKIAWRFIVWWCGRSSARLKK